MTVDIERFGPPPYVDYRWERDERPERTSLAESTEEFVIRGRSRVYNSERLGEIGRLTRMDGWGNNPPVDDENWSILSFMLAFSGEASQDSDSAKLRLSLDETKRFPATGLTVISGGNELEISLGGLMMPPLGEGQFFRDLAVCIEAAYGVADEELISPDKQWPYEVVYKQTAEPGWRIAELTAETGPFLELAKS